MLGRQEEIKPLGKPGQYVSFPSTSLLHTTPFLITMNYPSDQILQILPGMPCPVSLGTQVAQMITCFWLFWNYFKFKYCQFQELSSIPGKLLKVLRYQYFLYMYSALVLKMTI